MDKKIFAFIKLISIAYLIIFLPQVIYYKTNSFSGDQKNKIIFMNGLENLIGHKEGFDWLKKLNLCLVCDEEKILDSDGKRDVDLLIQNGFKVKKIVVPTSKQEFKKSTLSSLSSKKEEDQTTCKVPVFKWNTDSGLLPVRHLRTMDAIVFDMNGFGIRYDLCYSALVKAMQAASQNNKKLIVLDRPNLLGEGMEGPGEIPTRPGLTVGEMANYLNRYVLHNPVCLTVVPMINWKRNKPLISAQYNRTSKDVGAINSFYGYSVLSLLGQIKPINVDTTGWLAYQLFLLPENNQLSEWETEYLKKLALKLGLVCKDYFDQNENSKACFKGVRVKISRDINKFSAFSSMLTLARFLKNRKNVTLNYSVNFDDMLGSTLVRDFLQKRISFEELKSKVGKSLREFYSKAKSCFLYEPFPQPLKVKIIRG